MPSRLGIVMLDAQLCAIYANVAAQDPAGLQPESRRAAGRLSIFSKDTQRADRGSCAVLWKPVKASPIVSWSSARSARRAMHVS